MKCTKQTELTVINRWQIDETIPRDYTLVHGSVATLLFLIGCR